MSPTVDAVPVEPPLGSASAAPTALEAPAYDWLGDPAPDDPDDNHDSGGAVMRDDADDAEGLHARDALGTDDWDDEDDEDDWDDVDSSAPLATHEAEAGTAPVRALAPSPVFPPTRQHHREVQHSPWVPRTTGEAVLAGIVASIVATLAVWFLTRGDDERDSD